MDSDRPPANLRMEKYFVLHSYLPIKPLHQKIKMAEKIPGMFTML